MSRLSRERKTVEIMIKIHCRDKHGAKTGLCEECTDLASYTSTRLDKCRYGEGKPTCANCPVHCYNREMRRKIKDVMRHSGPKMLFRHPVLAIRHVMDGFKKVDEKK